LVSNTPQQTITVIAEGWTGVVCADKMVPFDLGNDKQTQNIHYTSHLKETQICASIT